MSKGYAIELYFDPALEDQALRSWNALVHRQITTQLIEMESRPHITLFSASSQFLDRSKLETVIKKLATKHQPLNLTFSSIGCLTGGEGNVLFLSPTPTLSLLQFHSKLCDLLRKEGIEIGDEFRVDSWMPFCAVAQKMPNNRTIEAFGVIREMNLPTTGFAMMIGLVEFSPIRRVLSLFVLGNSADS